MMGGAIGLGFALSLKDNVSRGLSAIQSKMQSTMGMTREMTKTFSDAGKMLINGAGMVYGGAKLLGNAFLGPLTSAASLEMEMAKVATIAGKSSDEMKDLQKEVERLSVSYGKTQEEVAKGLYTTISAGVTDANEAVKVLDVASKMGVAGVTTTATAVDGLTSVLNAYHLSADKTMEVSDAMFTAMKRGKTSMEALASSMGVWTGNAANLGLAYQDALGAIAAATLPGMSTQMAAQGLKSFLAAFEKPTKMASEAAHQFGIELSAATIKSKGLYGVMKEVYEKTAGNEEAISQIFSNVRTATFVKNVMSGEGAAFMSIMEDMQKAAGATDEAFQHIAGTFQFRLDVLNSAMELFRKKLGAVLLRPMGFIVDAVRNVFTALNKLPEPIFGIIAGLTGFVGTALVLTGTLIAVAGVTKMWGIGLTVLKAQLVVFKGAALGALKVLAGYMPMAAAIAAAAGIVYLAWKNNWGGLRDTVEGVMAGLKMAISAGTDGIAKVDAKTAKKLQEMGIWEFAISAGRAFYRVRMFFEGFVEGVKTSFELMKSYFTGASETLRFIWEPVIEWVTQALGIFGIVRKAGADSTKALGGSFGVVAGALATGLIAMKGWRIGLGLIKGAFSPVLGVFKLGRLLIKGLTSDLVKNAAALVLDKGAKLASAAATKIATAAQWLWNVALNANPISLVIAGIAAFATVVYLLYKHWEPFRKWWDGLWASAKEKAAAAKDWVVEKWTALVEWFKAVPDRMSEATANMWQGVKDKAAAAKQWCVDKWEELVTWFKGLPDRIMDAIAGLKDRFTKWFSGLWDKIIPDWAKTLFGNVGNGGPHDMAKEAGVSADLYNQARANWLKSGDLSVDAFKAGLAKLKGAQTAGTAQENATASVANVAAKTAIGEESPVNSPKTPAPAPTEKNAAGMLSQHSAVVQGGSNVNLREALAAEKPKPVNIKSEVKIQPGVVKLEIDGRAIGEAAVQFVSEQQVREGADSLNQTWGD